jgi:hypothetical protein
MIIYPRSEDFRPVILCTAAKAARFNEFAADSSRVVLPEAAAAPASGGRQ